MIVIRSLGALLLSLACAAVSSGQDKKAANPAATPPSYLLLVRQEILPGRASERQKLETTIARACDRLDAPNTWLSLQSRTGPQEALSFETFDSFEHLEQSDASWRHFYATHADLARMREASDALVGNEHTIVAVRRDELGYLAENFDLSETRFMRVVEVRLFPGRENDFVEASRILSDAYAKIQADIPRLVFQVNLGMSTPAFLIIVPMSVLAENDDLLTLRDSLVSAEGEAAAERLEQIARESYASTQTNLYTVRPEMSHVSREFAASDPDFWRRGTETETRPETNPSINPSKRKPYAKSPPNAL